MDFVPTGIPSSRSSHDPRQAIGLDLLYINTVPSSHGSPGSDGPPAGLAGPPRLLRGETGVRPVASRDRARIWVLLPAGREGSSEGLGAQRLRATPTGPAPSHHAHGPATAIRQRHSHPGAGPGGGAPTGPCAGRRAAPLGPRHPWARAPPPPASV